MKRLIALIMALTAIFMLCSAYAEGNQTDEPDFEGVWIYERAEMVIMPDTEAQGYSGRVYTVEIWWGSSANEMTYWYYPMAAYDEINGGLVCEGLGIRDDITLHEDSDEDIVTVFEDGSALFYLANGGRLMWRDYYSYPDQEDIAFEKAVTPSEAPSAESFVSGYFMPVASADESSLYAAAYAACKFASDNGMWYIDYAPFRSNMLSGWEGLDDETRAAFDKSFMEIVLLMDKCTADWEASRALFEEAGLADAMDAYMFDPLGIEAWNVLKAHTLTMGNSEE